MDRDQRKQDRAEYYRNKSAQAQANSYAYWEASNETVRHIPMGQPILVGHYSEGRHRRTLDRSWNQMGKSVKLGELAKHYEYKAEAALANDAIYTDDDKAVEKLEEKVKELQEYQERMVAINKILRSKKLTSEGKIRKLQEDFGYEEEKAKKIIENGIIPSFRLSNNSANLRRYKERLERVRRQKAKEPEYYEMGTVRIELDYPENRIRVIFPYKPQRNTLDKMDLRKRGFRYSKTARCWQAYLSQWHIMEEAKKAVQIFLEDEKYEGDMTLVKVTNGEEEVEREEREKYPLSTYFSNLRENDPKDLLSIARYRNETGEYPFVYEGENFVYDTLITYFKTFDIETEDSILTPTAVKTVADTIAAFREVTDTEILYAHCGLGQLVEPLQEKGFKVLGTDIDAESIELCKALYPDTLFFVEDNYYGYDPENQPKWKMIVAHLPAQINEIEFFMEWLSSGILDDDGYAFIILPYDIYSVAFSEEMSIQLEKLKCIDYKAIGEDVPYSHADDHLFIFTEPNRKELLKTETMKTIEPVSLPEPVAIQPEEKKEPSPLSNVHMIPLEEIVTGVYNPRQVFTTETIEELAETIKATNGLLQPIGLNEIDGQRILIYGERRYRAYQFLGWKEIPASIYYNLSRKEAMERAAVENIQREDITPLEEAVHFKTLMEECTYDLPELALRLGKKVEYIKGRLALNQLIEDFRKLFNEKQLTLGKALELTRYSAKIQQMVFNNNFNSDNPENSWKNLSTADFKSLLEAAFSTRLSLYSFDKTECQTCPYNTSNHLLFAEFEDAKCTFKDCLENKKKEYILEGVHQLKVQNPEIEVSISLVDTLPVELKEELKKESIPIVTKEVTEYPVPPVEPKKENFRTEEQYKEALYQFEGDMQDYQDELDEIQSKIQSGEYRQSFYIGDHTPRLGYYKLLPGNSKKEPKEEKEELQEKIKKAEENCIRNILQECYKEYEEVLPPSTDLTEKENDWLLIVVLSLLSSDTLVKNGLLKKGEKLTDDILSKLMEKLTASQRNILIRQFLLEQGKKTGGKNFKTGVFLLYLQELSPEKYKSIETKHKKQFKEQADKYKKRLTVLNKEIKESKKTTENVTADMA